MPQRPDEKVNIRPEVSILSVLKHLNYRPWFAIAEFVDNAIQNFLANRVRSSLRTDRIQSSASQLRLIRRQTAA